MVLGPRPQIRLIYAVDRLVRVHALHDIMLVVCCAIDMLNLPLGPFNYLPTPVIRNRHHDGLKPTIQMLLHSSSDFMTGPNHQATSASNAITR